MFQKLKSEGGIFSKRRLINNGFFFGKWKIVQTTLKGTVVKNLNNYGQQIENYKAMISEFLRKQNLNKKIFRSNFCFSN